MKKRIIPFLLTLCLAAALCLTAALLPGEAATVGNNPADSQNIYANNYTVWTDTVRSYLYENDSGGMTRVELINKQIVVEEYDSSFQYLSGRTIPFELDIWGGFFAGKDYNFLIFGQDYSWDGTGSIKKEVIRVVKYSKDWQRLGQASYIGTLTVTPFAFGSLRCAEYGGMLYIFTSQLMDNGHQGNLFIAVRESDMNITGGIDTFYVSHSFNQFILIDQQQNIVTLDHGDGAPRAAVVMMLKEKAGSETFLYPTSDVIVAHIQDFPGEIGVNATGASLGGFAETRDGYVAAYNYNGVGNLGNGTASDRSVYFGYVDKETHGVKTQKISAGVGNQTPSLVPTGLDGGYILWNASDSAGNGTDTLYYAKYSADGTVGAVKTATASLSDCQPIVYNGKLVWYSTGNGNPVIGKNTYPIFYQLDENGVTAVMPAITGTCGNGLTWTFDNGALTVAGKGAMSDYTSKTPGPWVDTRIPIPLQTAAIGDGVTSIGDYAFYDCADLTSVTIGTGVTSIGEGAFRGCTGLTGLTLPSGVTSIGERAFMGCTSLTRVNIPSGVTKIEDGTFNSCLSLTGVTIPDKVTSIGTDAFRACTSLTGLTIPDSVASIGEDAFERCSGLTSVSIGKGVAKIEHYAFRFCSNLTDVSIHSDITDSGYGIFEGCGKLTVTFGDDVTAIGAKLFNGSSDALTSVTIGGNVTSIEVETFNGCKNLTSVTIGSGVTSIGDRAFNGCTSLTSVSVGSGVSSIGANAFRNTPWLTNQGEFAIVNGILFAYQGSGEAVIPGSVTKIGPYAFADCTALTRVTIPVSVVTVEDHAFWGCSGLSRVHYEGSSTQWKAITIEIGNDRLINANRSYGSTGTGTELTTGMFTVNTASETYDGKAKTKTVTGKYAGTALVEGKDYTVTYADNTNAGTATITITGQGSYTGTLTYQFTINQAERTLTAAMNPAQLRVGGTAGKITLTDNAVGDNPSYTYTSGSASVATVSDGTVTAVGRGVTTITINAPATANYKAGSAKINVTATNMPVQELWFVYDIVEKTCGDPAFTITVNNLATGGGAVTYTSSDPSVATVDAASGKVTILSAGTTTITATAAEVTDVWAETSVSYTLVVSPNTTSDPGEPEKPPFTDVDDTAYYTDAVAWAVANNVTNGTTSTTFSPNESCTRGQIVTFLWRAYGSPEPTSTANPFTDVKPGSYYYDAVLWAVEKGITSGTSATTFSPDEPCTRAQAVTFQYRAAGSPAVTGGTTFKDVTMGQYYTNAVTWAVAKGITSGTTTTTFSPDGNCTRGQIVTFLHRQFAPQS